MTVTEINFKTATKKELEIIVTKKCLELESLINTINSETELTATILTSVSIFKDRDDEKCFNATVIEGPTYDIADALLLEDEKGHKSVHNIVKAYTELALLKYLGKAEEEVE